MRMYGEVNVCTTKVVIVEVNVKYKTSVHSVITRASECDWALDVRN
jgi:hypothetical protein